MGILSQLIGKLFPYKMRRTDYETTTDPMDAGIVPRDFAFIRLRDLYDARRRSKPSGSRRRGYGYRGADEGGACSRLSGADSGGTGAGLGLLLVQQYLLRFGQILRR